MPKIPIDTIAIKSNLLKIWSKIWLYKNLRCDMKVQQEILPYRPITIKLEKKHEAVALFGLIDKIDGFICNKGEHLSLTSDEINLVIELSNLHTSMAISIT